MKEHVQKPGVRKWAGEDLIELQGESLTAIQALVEPYAPCVIQGCEVSQDNGVYQVQPGIVALKGSNEDGNACTKIVRFSGYTGAVMPIYLTIKVTPYMRVYADEENKPIAYEYTAESSTTQPAVPYLMIDDSGAERLVDTIGITQKLDRDGGNASNVKVVSFVSDTANDRSNIETGSSLKELFGKIRRWFNDLGKLAFKSTVGTSDFDGALKTAFNNKVDKDGDKVLSECDFSQAEKEKLKNIADGANNYSLPAATKTARGGVKVGTGMSISGDILSHSTAAGYKHIPSGGSAGQYLKYNNASGTAQWATPTASEVGALPTTGGTINGSLNVTGQLKENGYRVFSYKNKPDIGSIYNVIIGHVTSKGVVTCSSDQKVKCTLYNQYNGVCYLETDGYTNGVISVIATDHSIAMPSRIDKDVVIDEYIRFTLKFDNGPIDFDFIIFLWGEY